MSNEVMGALGLWMLGLGGFLRIDRRLAAVDLALSGAALVIIALSR